MPSFNAHLLTEVKTRNDQYDISTYDNGFLIRLFVTLYNEDRRSLQIVCDDIEDVIEYVRAIDKIGVDG